MLEETAQEWRKQALKEGRREGEIAGMREMLLQLLATRFGRLPDGIRLKVEEISSKQDLRKLARKALKAKSLQQLGL